VKRIKIFMERVKLVMEWWHSHSDLWSEV